MVIMLVVPLAAAVISIGFAFQKRWIAFIGDKGAAVYATRGDRHAIAGTIVHYAEIADIKLAIAGRRKQWLDWMMTCVGKDQAVLFTMRGNAKRVDTAFKGRSAYRIASAIPEQWKQRRPAAFAAHP